MTAVFEQYGMRIQYPENWELQQSQTNDESIEVQIASPSGAFWSVVAFDQNVQADELMSDLLKSIDQQYDSAEWTKVQESLHGFDSTGFDTYFYCLDLLVFNRMRSLECGDSKLLLMYQAESREFDKMELVLDAITISMLSFAQAGGGKLKVEVPQAGTVR